MDGKLEGMNEEQLLELDSGLFKVSEVEKVLELEPGALRTLALKLARKGESPYRKWGIGTSAISHWVVRIKVFAKRWEDEIKPLLVGTERFVGALPGELTPEELCRFDGVVRLSDLKGRFPFHQQSIKNQVRKLGICSRETMGCWKDRNHFYVDVQRFLSWINQHRYR